MYILLRLILSIKHVKYEIQYRSVDILFYSLSLTQSIQLKFTTTMFQNRIINTVEWLKFCRDFSKVYLILILGSFSNPTKIKP